MEAVSCHCAQVMCVQSVFFCVSYMLILGNSEVLWGKFDCVSYFSYHVGACENLAMLKDLLLKGLV